MTVALWLLALALLLRALRLWRRGRRQVASERMLGHLQARDAERRTLRFPWLRRELLRAGLELHGPWLRVVSGGVLGVLLLTALLGNWLGFCLLLLLVPLALGGWIRLRYRRRLRRMLEQLPALLDQVIRSLKSGRTLADGLLHAMQDSAEPLNSAFARTSRNVLRGMPLDDAMDDFADLYESDELRILALGVRVNQRYGGNASDLLASLIALIRDRDKGARQLRALTGETRITAYLLGALPVGLASYIFLTNPAFILGMWGDASGRWVLLCSALLQIVGSLLLWRMMRSIA
ncbi:type II secretion system protein F [Stutzerimonas kirkiae]|uniref:Type II secretion system protein F n=1 Tax=Stutzerimonas kirkiae TaxID=2211392 RepID=A0A4Q9QX23_9GAMM|nr:type II secretion system F family protein [Stutzerimonas kirkiae]TBU89062.1 type II secretion system protein F [Stutzerimonas kirkiae]TBU99403.1 type II secretion system protein F [Stutzerimonas kirkiae]TBV14876.1 type II secretion system protein F [Stutzerimonas kirkiae]